MNYTDDEKVELEKALTKIDNVLHRMLAGDYLYKHEVERFASQLNKFSDDKGLMFTSQVVDSYGDFVPEDSEDCDESSESSDW